MSKPRRSDVTSRMLCEAILEHDVFALDMLAERFPPKVLIAAVHRDSCGLDPLIDWGTSPWVPFLAAAGYRLLEVPTEIALLSTWSPEKLKWREAWISERKAA